MPDYSVSDSLPTSLFDIVIVGSGVVGCAMARRFSLEGASVLVIEKEVDILDGASKANSAILHTGFDAPPPGSQEHACIVDGYNEYLDIHSRLNLPLLECGAMVLAWNDAEASR
ncbi:MAG: FAD-dependent oxidoreductase, partial [Gammaproteobacteria bacterium]|nr:FAD-dependent oxidoreductase [Gammaproteobacteria bacterium]